ncbi:MAG TPA: sigma-70 family RNA polymerase sigma factor [Steroidobacteraceae bacterium]|nr:sigma-70 family RNA polymerase sigma factor [Steroidobacteraceae bacterium]
MSTPDQDLVSRLLRGEARAFDQFFNEYYPKLYRFVKRRLPHDSAAAEDVAQATLCRALESLRTFRGEAALMTWLCTLCRRELAARWRDVQPYATAPLLAEDDPEVRAALESLLAAESSDPLLLAANQEVRASICAALDYLPAPYGDILEWKYVRDLSVAEIALRLGRSVKATESLLTRAREAFRETFTLLRGGAAGVQP